MFAQFFQDVLNLWAAIQTHSVSAIVVAALAIVTLFSSQVGTALGSVWTFITGLFTPKS